MCAAVPVSFLTVSITGFQRVLWHMRLVSTPAPSYFMNVVQGMGMGTDMGVARYFDGVVPAARDSNRRRPPQLGREFWKVKYFSSSPRQPLAYWRLTDFVVFGWPWYQRYEATKDGKNKNGVEGGAFQNQWLDMGPKHLNTGLHAGTVAGRYIPRHMSRHMSKHMSRHMSRHMSKHMSKHISKHIYTHRSRDRV